MSIHFIDVEIFGRIIKVHCPKNYSSELLSIADILNNRLQKLKEKTGVSNIEKLIFITALNICYEFNLEKKNNLNNLNNLNIIKEKICILNTKLQKILK